MAIKRMPITDFVVELQKAEARKDGYIMGSKGQDPKKWSTSSWFFTQYKDRKKYTAKQEKAALNWRKTAQRVWDCNGLAEGIYEDFSGVNINTDTDGKARFNYARWCDVKGSGMIPVQYRVPGAAIFWGSKSSSITHVAYLEKPVKANNPAGDWYIIEARGVTYGVVRTKLNTRKPNFWGLMTKYFDYETKVDTTIIPTTPVKPDELGKRILKKGMKGDDVEQMQDYLMALGYDMKSYGSDGDFGSTTLSAVKKFQKQEKLKVDGHFGPLSLKAMQASLKKYPATGKFLQATKSCYVYASNTFASSKVASCSKNRKFSMLEEKPVEGWYKIIVNGKVGYVYKDYVKAI